MSIDLQYSLENLGGGQTSLGIFFLFSMYWWKGTFSASCFPRRGKGGIEAVLVDHVWEVEGGGVGGLSVAALSSGA